MKAQEWQAVTDCVDELVDAILERYAMRSKRWARPSLSRALEDRLFAEIAQAARLADEEVAAPALELPFVPWPEYDRLASVPPPRVVEGGGPGCPS